VALGTRWFALWALRDLQRRRFRARVADQQVLLLNVGFLVALFQFMVAVPVTMTAKGFTPAAYGGPMAVNGVLIALLQPFSAQLTRRFESAHVLALASLLVGAGFGAYAFCATGFDFAVATGVWSLGEILSVPLVSALVAQLAPPHMQGRYQGLLGLSFGLALAVAPAISGAALEVMGANVLWAGTSAFSVLVAAGHLAAGRKSRGELEGITVPGD